MKSNKSEQGTRIATHFLNHPNEDIPALDLHVIGSNKDYGFCASLSRRISDLRAIGMNIILSRDERVNNQRRTWYKFIPA